MNEYLKNLYLENLIKESHPEDEEERALLRTILEKNLFSQEKYSSSSLYGRFDPTKQEANND